jgi:hypothetical protein
MKNGPARLAKTPAWVVTAAVAVAAVAYVLLVFLPFQKSIADLRQQLHDKHLQIMQSDQLLLPLSGEAERLAEIRQHTGEWEQHAPGPQELAAFFARLSEQASRADVPLLKFEPCKCCGSTRWRCRCREISSSYLSFSHGSKSCPKRSGRRICD